MVKPMSIPALNKWTKVYPSFGQTVLLFHFHDLVPKALQSRLGSVSDPVDSSSEAEEEKQLGVPMNETKKWRKLARKRNRRAATFMNDQEAKWLCLMWLVLVYPIMSLHWKLFKQVTWYTDRIMSDERLHLLGQFCTPSRNPALQVLDLVMQCLSAPNQSLAVMFPFHGVWESWSQYKLRTLRRATLVAAGQLVRKLIEPWLRYPWRLFGLTSDSDDDVLQEAARVLNAKPCCVDSGLTRRLRARFPTPAGLSGQAVRHFIKLLFERIVITSTFIERKFANFSTWTKAAGEGISAANLASKHITQSFREAVNSWKESVVQRDPSRKKKRSNNRRPEWAKARKKVTGRCNGYHCFVQARKEAQVRDGNRLRGEDAALSFLKQCKGEWDNLTLMQKEAYGQEAKAKNAMTLAAQHAVMPEDAQGENIMGGPWSLSNFDQQFPLDLEKLDEGLNNLGGLSAAAAAWKQEMCCFLLSGPGCSILDFT